MKEFRKMSQFEMFVTPSCPVWTGQLLYTKQINQFEKEIEAVI